MFVDNLDDYICACNHPSNCTFITVDYCSVVFVCNYWSFVYQLLLCNIGVKSFYVVIFCLTSG